MVTPLGLEPKINCLKGSYPNLWTTGPYAHTVQSVMTDLPKKAILIYGAILFAVAAGLLIYSMFRKPVTNGPMPDPWKAGSGTGPGDGGGRTAHTERSN